MEIFKQRRCFATLLIVMLFVVAGCGRGDWGYLQGIVTLNGQPVGPGTISFEPVAGDRAGATASFGEDGKYSVISAGRKEGAPAGDFRVTIRGGEGFSEEPGARAASKIPARYANPTTSGLNVSIEPGKNSADFDLQP